MDGFLLGMTKQIRKAIEDNARKLKVNLKDSNMKVERDDILAGLVAVITVRIAEPQFQGQTKDVLGTAQVKPIVSKMTDKQFGEMITGSKRGYKEQSGRVLEKIVGEMHARIQARKTKEVTRRKNALESASMPPKLSDCQPGNDDVAELFIVEGDSALGTAKAARNSGFQALLPIRGKILNVQKASLSQMLSNKECAAIIQVVGAGSGASFDIEQARYNKVIMMTDADVDGAHIRILLLTLFYRYMRPLIEYGHVYAAVPPLHRIALTGARKGSTSIRIPMMSLPENWRSLTRSTSATTKISSVTRVLVRWTPISWLTPPWIHARACCAVFVWKMPNRPVRSSAC